MKSRIGFLIMIVFFALCTWYLFIKQYDYQYRFSVETTEGVVFQRITDWTTSNINSIDSVVTVNKRAFNKIRQIICSTGQCYEVNWKINKSKDSITNVSIGLKSKEAGIYDRARMLVGKSQIKKNTLPIFRAFRQYLDNFLISTTVSDNISFSESPNGWYAYVNIESDIKSKANGMMMNNAYINAFLSNNDIALIGKPFLEVLDWDVNNQIINFNFCFPIEYRNDLPQHEHIRFKEGKSKKGLKVIYTGNYRYSDAGWYSLLEFAKKNNINLELRPVEVYLNNPITDGNEKDWKAEVFMPVREKSGEQ